MRRRRLLRTSAVALAAGLAGCAGGDGNSTPTDADGTPTATPTATPTSGGDGGGAEGGSGLYGGDGTPTPTAAETPTAAPGDGGSPTATPSGSPTSRERGTATPTATPRQAAQVVDVGPSGDIYSFAPDPFEVATGETVVWVWRSSGHNVVVESAPGGSDWSGTGGATTYNAGYTHSHTFTTAGEYAYFCSPHESLGMTGSFTVTG